MRKYLRIISYIEIGILQKDYSGLLWLINVVPGLCRGERKFIGSPTNHMPYITFSSSPTGSWDWKRTIFLMKSFHNIYRISINNSFCEEYLSLKSTSDKTRSFVSDFDLHLRRRQVLDQEIVQEDGSINYIQHFWERKLQSIIMISLNKWIEDTFIQDWTQLRPPTTNSMALRSRKPCLAVVWQDPSCEILLWRWEMQLCDITS